MKKQILIVFLLVAMIPAAAQKGTQTDPGQYYIPGVTTMTARDSAWHNSLPVLTLPTEYRIGQKTLPSYINNSQLPYFRPIYYQNALECGQAAGICYAFTYEMARMRDVAANNGGTQYPSHFAWNFRNEGSNQGVNCLETWDVLRMAGTPNVTDWGGSPNYGGEKRWLSGYQYYIDAMHNRIYEVYAIPVNTPEGLQTLKTWLNDHLDGSTFGGVANFYSTYISNSYNFNVLPAGTPDAGMKVITQFSNYVNHCQTIVGYNDQICWDYNLDGQYTNNIDINTDGVVDMRDWEVGGLIFANSFGTAFADNGFCYMTYRNLAESLTNGGIWNNCVYVMRVKEDCSPLVTLKVKVKHVSRQALRVMAGISDNTSATAPDFTTQYSVFNFQGGNYYMTGGTTEADKTLEFGLDASELLNHIQPGSPARIFLDIFEEDNTSSLDGMILSYSVIDYTSGTPVETIYPQDSINLLSDSHTILGINVTPSYTKPEIDDLILPDAESYDLYQHQLTVTGGTAPYHFEFLNGYTPSSGTEPFPMTGSLVTLSNIDNGFLVKDLAFDFPFYGKKYDQIVIRTDGYIEFYKSEYTWPFLIDDTTLMKSHQMIAPFLANLFVTTGFGIYFETNSSYTTVRWHTRISGQTSSVVNVALRLYPDGNIQFYYGNIQTNTGTTWKAVVSRGNFKDYLIHPISGSFTTNVTDKSIFLDAYDFPEGITLSDGGELSGMFTSAFSNWPLQIEVTDNNELVNNKTVYLNCTQDDLVVVLDYSVISGGDTIIQPGETASMDVTIKNISTVPATNAQITASTQDPYITFTDSVEYFGYIGPGNIYTLNNAFHFTVASSVPNMHPVPVVLTVTCDSTPSVSNVTLVIYGTDLTIEQVTVGDDNNDQMDAYETDTLYVVVKNISNTSVSAVNAVLSNSEPEITILDGTDTEALITAGDTATFVFVIQNSSALPEGLMYDFVVDFTATGSFHDVEVFSLFAGTASEDYETGNLSLFSWQTSTFPWYVTSTGAYEGSYCARSGDVNDNQQSDLSLTENVMLPGLISFWWKVDCENDPGGTNYDWLAFKINGNEKERWDGTTTWAFASYPVAAGNTTFLWSYVKDYSVSAGSDCAWLDFISFPVFGPSNALMDVAPDSIILTMNTDELFNLDMSLMNTGTSIILYTIEIKDDLGNPVSWLSALYYNGSLNPSATGTIPLTFNTNNIPQGIYSGSITVTYNSTQTIVIPVVLTVLDITGNTVIADRDSWIMAYPNPSSGPVSFRFGNKYSFPADMVIYDINGRITDHIRLETPVEILRWDHACSAGLYFWKAENGIQSFSGKISITE